MRLERVDWVKGVFVEGYEEPVYRVIKLSERNDPNARPLIQTPDWAIALHVSHAVNTYIAKSERDNNFEKVEAHKCYDLDKPNTTDLGFEDAWCVVRPSNIKKFGLDDCIFKTNIGNLARTITWAINNYIDDEKLREKAEMKTVNSFERVQVFPVPDFITKGACKHFYVCTPREYRLYGHISGVIKVVVPFMDTAEIVASYINESIAAKEAANIAYENSGIKPPSTTTDPRHKTAQELAPESAESLSEAFTSEHVVDKDLEKRFTYHAPKEGQPEIYQDLREEALSFGYLIKECVPDCRERNLALTKLEEVVFWANAGVARS